MGGSASVALVTGASSGIGEVFARRLSQKGCRLLLIARRRERLEKLAEEIQNAEVLPADLTVDSDLGRIEDRVAAEPNLEFLVNNAGFGVPGLYYEASLEAQDRMHRLHIIAIERLTHTVVRGMVQHKKGTIINVSSVAGFLQNPQSVGYCATKAWINSFTEGLYLELKSIGSPVRVQALCPGFTYSEFHDVLGMDRSLIPKYLWMPAEYVVDESLRGLQSNRLFVIPGWRYRLIVGLLRHLPQSARHFVALKYGRSRMKTGSEDGASI
jgi:short-subunit dehydrogenase